MPISASSPSLSFFSSTIFLSSPHHFPKSRISPSSSSLQTLKPPVPPHTLTIRSDLATLPVLSFAGETVGETFLDLKSAPLETARSVVHRGIIADQQNKRRGTASTLTRGEVRGGGKKPYPQKKTGRARRGSQRTPLRPGGGVVFGPKPKDWSIKINRKEKRLALSTALSSAVVADALVVEDFESQFEEKPTTKEFVAAMRRWGLDPKQKAMFVMMDVPDNVRLSSRNIGTLKMLTPRTLNLFDVLNSDKLVFTTSAVEYLNSIYGVNAEGDDEEDGGDEGEDAGEFFQEGEDGEESSGAAE